MAPPHKTPSNVRLTPFLVPAHSNRSVGLGPAAQGGRALAMLSLLLPVGMAHLHPAAEHAVPQGLNAAPGAHNARVNDQPASAEQLARHLSFVESLLSSSFRADTATPRRGAAHRVALRAQTSCRTRGTTKLTEAHRPPNTFYLPQTTMADQLCAPLPAAAPASH